MLNTQLEAAPDNSGPGAEERDRGVGDRELLERFIERADEHAFTALVKRHGPVVWGVCRRILGHEQDAEDAFQVAILLLARKAKSIRKGEAVGSWLHGVAYRTAMKLGRSAARRHHRERQAVSSIPPQQPPTQAACRELQRILDEEVQRLAEIYRAPFVLCGVEGMSKAEAARELGWKEGTVSGRLARARKQLQKRLARRGVALSAVLTAGALAQNTAGAAAPPLLFQATAKAVLGTLAGKTAAVSPAVVALADGVLRTMAATKVKAALTLLVGLLVVGAGSGLAAIHFGTADEDENTPPPANVADISPPDLMAVVTRKQPVSAWVTLAFSPDGNKLVTADARFGAKGHIKIWETASGKELIDLVDPHGTRAVVFSPDGQTLASGDFGGAIRLRDPTTGRERAVLRANNTGINGLAFSPDGTLLASAGLDNAVRIWDLKARAARSVLQGHTDRVYSVAYFRHGQALVSGGRDRTAIIWDLTTGKARLTLKGHGAAIEMVAVSPDDKLVATASWDGMVRLWDAQTGKNLALLPGLARLPTSPMGAYAVAFSPDGKLLAGSTGDGLIPIWDIETHQQIHLLGKHADTIWALAFSRDGKRLASGSTDMTVRLLDVSDIVAARLTATLVLGMPLGDLLHALAITTAIDPSGWGALCAPPAVVLTWRGDTPHAAAPPPPVLELPPPPISDDFYYDFRGGKALPPFFRLVGVDDTTVIQPEEEGLRVTLPLNRQQTGYAGVLLPYPLQGDFEITAGYEILDANRPQEGHGVGFSLYLTTATALPAGLGFERLSRTNEGEVFILSRMTTTPAGRQQYEHKFHQTTSKSGRLRLVRTGEEVSFLAADGSGDFRKIFAHHMDAEDLQTVRLAAYPGYAHNVVDLRIHDLRIRKLGASESQAVAGQLVDPDNSGPGAGLSLVLVISLLFTFSFAGWLWMRQTRRAGQAAAPDRQAPDSTLADKAPVSFACSACGKSLKARAELTGKRVKCPKCGKAVRVQSVTANNL